MIPDKIHRGVIKKGRFSLDDRTAMQSQLAGLEGKRVEVVVRPERKRRSNNQNRYYFGVVLRIVADHTGYTQEELHTYFKQTFLSEPDQGFIGLKVKSSKEVSTLEFEEYLSNVRMFAAQELGLYIPLPNEVDY